MTDSSNATDLELLHLAADGKWDAFDELVRRLEPRVIGLTQRILGQRADAEDATQSTFISILDNLGSFRGESSVATWVLRTASNQALTILRKRRVRYTVPLDREVDDAGDGGALPHPHFIAQWRDDPAALAQQSEVKELLDKALDELDDKHRVVFVLRDVEQFSTRETAETLGISESNVKVRLLRARLKLRERLTVALGDDSTRVFPDPHHH